MLVVGRPGAGCTTFLKALAGLNNGYAGVEGVVRYGNMMEGKGLKAFRSDVIFNSEEGESKFGVGLCAWVWGRRGGREGYAGLLI